MDLKALLSRLEVLDKKQNLMESDDRKPAKQKERDVTLPSGAKVKARTVQGWQSQRADKEAEKDRKDENVNYKSGIANALLKEFGLDEEGSVGGDPSTLTVYGKQGQVDPAKTAAAQAAAGAPAGGAAAAPTPDGFKFSPEQEKWLGGADRQDPFILSRMPGPKPPLSYFKDPENKQIAQQRFAKVFVDAPAAAPAQAPTAAKDDRNEMDKASDLAASQQASPTAGSSANPPAASGGEKGSKPVGPQASSQEKMDRFVYLMNKKKGAAAVSKPLQLPPGAEPEPGMTVAKEDFMSMLLNKIRNISESRIFEALSPEEEKELAAIAPEVVRTSQTGAGVPPEVLAAVKDFQGSSAAPQAGSSANPPAAPYKGSSGTQEIQKLNPDIKDVNKISVGQKIKLPSGQEYTVAKGDTLDGIAAGKFKGTPPAGDSIAQAPSASTKPGDAGSSANPPAASATPGIQPGQNARDDMLARQGKPAAGSSANPPTAGTGSGAGSSAFAAQDPRRTDLPAGSGANPPGGRPTMTNDPRRLDSPAGVTGSGANPPAATAPSGTSVSGQSSNTTTSKQGNTTTTNTQSSATIQGLDIYAARETPEWKAIYDKQRSINPATRERMADMAYKAKLAKGEIKPPAPKAAAPAAPGASAPGAPKQDFEEALEAMRRIAGLR